MKKVTFCFFLVFLTAACESSYEKKVSESMVAINDFLESGEEGVFLVDKLSSLECLTISSSFVGREGVAMKINKKAVDFSDRDPALLLTAEYCSERNGSLNVVEFMPEFSHNKVKMEPVVP